MSETLDRLNDAERGVKYAKESRDLAERCAGKAMNDQEREIAEAAFKKAEKELEDAEQTLLDAVAEYQNSGGMM